tara:strand:+ start:10184 stop:10444 length:261 start_codon:yes stop_codon:yes gene_type:complete
MLSYLNNNDQDRLLEESYNLLSKNLTKSVNRFVVYKEGSQSIEIPHGIGQRSKYIDLLIKHFSELEEYEKCSILQELRELVMMAGD